MRRGRWEPRTRALDAGCQPCFTDIVGLLPSGELAVNLETVTMKAKKCQLIDFSNSLSKSSLL